MVFVDLDGTLTRSYVNNTYAFISLLIHLRSTYLRRKIYKTMLRLTPAITSLYNFLKIGLLGISLDSILITVLLFGFDLHEIKRFSLYWLRILTNKRLINENILEYVKRLKSIGVKTHLITACIEYPACLIAKMLSIDECFGRRFILIGRKVVTVSPFSPHLLKARFLKQKHLNEDKGKVYIVDLRSAITEKRFLGLFDEIIIVGPDGTVLRSIKPNEYG